MSEFMLIGFLVVATVIALSRLGAPPSIAITSASLVAVVSVLGFDKIPAVYYTTLLKPLTIETMASVGAVASLVSLYRNTGLAKLLGEELSRALKSPKMAAIAVPAFMGLLPVPGGALMSASVVDEIGNKLGWRRDKKFFMNIWFRHALVIAYPLNSVIVVAASLANTSIWAVAAWSLIALIAMILLGYLFMARDTGESLSGGFSAISVVKGAAPILVALVVAVVGDLAGLSSRIAVLLGILSSIPVLVFASGLRLRDLVNPIYDRTVWDIVIVSFAALVLREVFSSIDYSNASSSLAVHPVIAMTLVPAIFGFLTGAVSAGVSVSIPMLSTFYVITAKEAALIYIAAFAGYMVSPLHLCMVYTLKYYGVDYGAAYRLLIPATSILLIIVAVSLTVI